MDVQLRYRGKGCVEKKFDKSNLHVILPQALSQSFGIGNIKHISDLPKQFDVKSYHPYTCRDVRHLCLPNYKDYEKNISENSFLTSKVKKNVNCFLNTNEDFQISIIDKKELSLWTKGAERQQKFFEICTNKKSFLPRTLGLYSYKEHKKTKTYFSVTNNVLPNDLFCTEKYTLKGSERRKKSCATLKDKEFKSKYRNGLIISREDFNELYAILKNDCELLSVNNWINYYLFIAIHEVKGQQTNKNQVGLDMLGDRTLEKDAFGLLGHRSHGIKATGPDGKNLLLFIGIRGHLREYTGMRKVGHSFIKHFTDNTLLHSPSDYKDRFLKEFQQKWFQTEGYLESTF